MAGYLDHYGAGEERRERITRRVVLVAVAALALGGIAYAALKDYPEERQARRFFDLLRAHNYQEAYTLWGCTTPDARPCHDYPYADFMKDWGPDAAQVNRSEVLDGESCGSGVIVDVDAGQAGEKKLWVERESHFLGFPPFERCPQGNRIHDFFSQHPLPASGKADPFVGIVTM